MTGKDFTEDPVRTLGVGGTEGQMRDSMIGNGHTGNEQRRTGDM
jgi:hypothetical protein